MLWMWTRSSDVPHLPQPNSNKNKALLVCSLCTSRCFFGCWLKFFFKSDINRLESFFYVSITNTSWVCWKTGVQFFVQIFLFPVICWQFFCRDLPCSATLESLCDLGVACQCSWFTVVCGCIYMIRSTWMVLPFGYLSATVLKFIYPMHTCLSQALNHGPHNTEQKRDLCTYYSHPIWYFHADPSSLKYICLPPYLLKYFISTVLWLWNLPLNFA